MKTDFKVLMTLMGMEIGGAETHVLELCKCLKRRGVDVYVISNGGVYVKELTDAGITHISAPLNNRKIKSLITSYKILKKTIIDNDIRLVHAHARIPAFLCGILQKKLHFRFVTTAHWIFNTAIHLKMLSDWGEYSLSVSEDIKKYLMDNYKVKSENIIVTINGIDTDKFSRDTDYSNVAEEFNFNKERTRIVSISRLDKSRSLAAHKLLEAAPGIKKAFPETEIVLVGGGDDFNEIERKANEINKNLGEKYIILTKARTEINEFLASADVFVGVSRAALEAMASEKPTIVAGNEGYIGIFDESKLAVGIETNFCCRGCVDTTTSVLLEDVLKLLSMTESERNRLGSYGREIIKQYYSVDRMADDAMRLYSMALKSNKPNDVVISGYYGFKNHGDDVLLASITQNLKELKPDIKITVLSKRPNDTKRDYNVNSVNRFNIPKIMKLFRNTNMLLSGGGTLIQDLTSTQSLVYYLYIINSAVKKHMKIMLYANGIGPIKEKNAARARGILQNVDLITLRDEVSHKELQKLGVDKPHIKVTADPAFGIKNHDPEKSRLLLEKLGLKNKKYFCVSLRSWSFLGAEFEPVIRDFCDYITEKYGYTAIFIPMQPLKDEEISKRILSGLKSPGVYIESGYSLSEILGVMEGGEFVIAMRLHAIIYAFLSLTPVIGLVYDPKVLGLMQNFKQKFYQDVKTPDKTELCGFADEIIENRDEIVKGFMPYVKSSAEMAFENARLAVELLERDEF